MSYFQTKCSVCGAVYWTGVIGTQFVGGHVCLPLGSDAKAAAALEELAKRPR